MMWWSRTKGDAFKVGNDTLGDGDARSCCQMIYLANKRFKSWNNGLHLPDYDIVADRNYYFIITSSGANEVTTTVIERVADSNPMFNISGGIEVFPGDITVYKINGQVVAHSTQQVSISHLDRSIYLLKDRSVNHKNIIKIAIDR